MRLNVTSTVFALLAIVAVSGLIAKNYLAPKSPDFQVSEMESRTRVAEMLSIQAENLIPMAEGRLNSSSIPYRIFALGRNNYSNGSYSPKRESHRGGVRFRHPTGKFPINQMLSIAIVFPKGALSPSSELPNQVVQTLEFDARMPDHNHGMRVTPVIKQLADDLWIVEGVNLHMKEEWELLLTRKTADEIDSGVSKVFLE